jgi:MYXO-CTERM domain-containing protein
MRSFAVRIGVLACAVALAGALGAPDRAEACGGCFAPIGSPTVVTRHEIAVAISPVQTTLWDQIEYAGSPEDFVWVLPVRGGVPVELADNAFFEALEQATKITLPVANPPVTFCGAGGFLGASAPRAPDAESGVTVYHQATIGPYETATIGSEDPNALASWLRDHGYAVPDAILPTIAYYTDQGMDFAVLRLAPDAGVNQMQPVRVTMPGMNPTFPLRMVSAGIQGKVGLELFVIAEGRYEAANFANAEVDRSRLSYDYALAATDPSAAFNYDALYDEAASIEGGRVWVTEYAESLSASYVQGYQSYDDVTGEPHSAQEDYDVAVTGLSDPYLTRMTSDMPAEFLVEDLILRASPGADLGNYILVTNDAHRPADAICADPYGSDGTGWRDRGDGCSVSPSREGSLAGAAIIAALGAAFALRRRRR